ncbi:MAG: glycosyltransferase family 4 protein [Hyphomicrobiaceae bacterium]|nr:glycosyltransferase family 4 protein [Hyphomicrobiaceae bacterium]
MVSRIHFVNRYFFPDHSATSQILSGVVFDLAERGYDVRVTTGYQLYENASAQLPRHETIRGVDVTRVATTRFGRTSLAGRLFDYLTFYVAAATHLLLTLRRGDIVIAKTDPPLLSLLIVPVAKLKGAICVNWLQDVFPEVATAVNLGGRPMRLLARPLKALRNLSLRAADQNVAIGEVMVDRFAGQGMDRARFTVIPNWADPDVIPAHPPGASELRREWGLEDRFVVAYSGNLGRVHEVDTIIDALENLNRSRPSIAAANRISFLFIGSGAQRRFLEREVARRQLENVVIKPYQPQERLADALAVADVHLVSLKPDLEGYVVPSKVYGVMAAGRPTLFVGAPHGEVARLIARHKCGVTIAAGASGRLANTILDLSQRPELCEEMGAAARKAFAASYTKRASSLSWHSMISELQISSTVGGTAGPAAANDRPLSSGAARDSAFN